MRNQLELLRTTNWQALIVLDACRADEFYREWYGAGAVRSPGVCTPAWLAKVGPCLAARRALYFTANPVVDRENRKRGLGLEVLSVWRAHWGRFTPLGIPSVHPLSVNGVVLTYRDLGRLEGRPVVVHYVQPHSPYIGDPPLALSRWGGSGGPPGEDLGAACHALTRPDVAVKRGECTWDDVRAAYRGNLRLAFDAAAKLIGQLGRDAVVTSDHGELLGEDGRFGHEGHWRHPALSAVPWFHVPAPEPDETTTCEKLEALGYA